MKDKLLIESLCVGFQTETKNTFKFDNDAIIIFLADGTKVKVSAKQVG